MADFFDVQVTTLIDLRSDQYGLLISDLSEIICEVFSEAPWNESFSAARIMFGLGVEMMRKNSILVIARHKQEGHLIGYILGQELVVESDDPRDQTFFKISGGYDLDFLANINQRTLALCGIQWVIKFHFSTEKINHVDKVMDIAVTPGASFG